MAVPPVPAWVPSQRPIASGVASVTSAANDKGDNEIPGAVQKSPGIYLTAEENSGNCLKLLISTCQMVILKAKITFKILPICVVNIKTLIKEMPM